MGRCGARELWLASLQVVCRTSVGKAELIYLKTSVHSVHAMFEILGAGVEGNVYFSCAEWRTWEETGSGESCMVQVWAPSLSHTYLNLIQIIFFIRGSIFDKFGKLELSCFLVIGSIRAGMKSFSEIFFQLRPSISFDCTGFSKTE